MKWNAALTFKQLIVAFLLVLVLVVLVWATLPRTKEAALAAVCMNNLNQLGKGFSQYLNDNDGAMFSRSNAADNSWPNVLQRKYVQGWRCYRSPYDKPSDARPLDATSAIPISYGINGALFDSTNSTWKTETSKLIFAAPAIVKTPGNTLAWQADAFSNQNCKITAGGSGDYGTYQQRTMLNVLFADFHTEVMSCEKFSDDFSEAGKMRWSP